MLTHAPPRRCFSATATTTLRTAGSVAHPAIWSPGSDPPLLLHGHVASRRCPHRRDVGFGRTVRARTSSAGTSSTSRRSVPGVIRSASRRAP